MNAMHVLGEQSVSRVQATCEQGSSSSESSTSEKESDRGEEESNRGEGVEVSVTGNSRMPMLFDEETQLSLECVRSFIADPSSTVAKVARQNRKKKDTSSAQFCAAPELPFFPPELMEEVWRRSDGGMQLQLSAQRQHMHFQEGGGRTITAIPDVFQVATNRLSATLISILDGIVVCPGKRHVDKSTCAPQIADSAHVQVAAPPVASVDAVLHSNLMSTWLCLGQGDTEAAGAYVPLAGRLQVHNTDMGGVLVFVPRDRSLEAMHLAPSRASRIHLACPLVCVIGVGSGPLQPGHTFELRGDSGMDDRAFAEQLATMFVACLMRPGPDEHAAVICNILNYHFVEAAYMQSFRTEIVDFDQQWCTSVSGRAASWMQGEPSAAYSFLRPYLTRCGYHISPINVQSSRCTTNPNPISNPSPNPKPKPKPKP